MQRIHLFFLLLASFSAFSQTKEDSVKQVITTFFEGMKNADTVQIRKTLSPVVVFQTIKNGAIQNESIGGFLSSISKGSSGDLDEHIRFESVKTDGDLASVWTPYSFFYKGKLLHCGANSFQLVRIQDIWKIQYIIDTRRKQPCEPK